MSATAARVRLEALDGAWAADAVREMEPVAVLRAGNAPDNELVLPRAPYVKIARTEFAVSFTSDAIRFLYYGAPRICRIDGEPAKDVSLSPGEHALELGDYRFRLSLSIERA